jgi:DNA-directed RNA polymerase subunit RPC12/RpoP
MTGKERSLMSGTCEKCGAHLETAWKFCPHCAASIAHETAEPEHEHPHREKPPVKSAFGGLLLGFIAAPVLIIYGGMICLTGLGVVLGIPMIVAGVCAPLIGSLMGLNAMHGVCPWCGAAVSGVGIFNRFSCPACSQRIVVKKRELLRAE